jgi:hypothetical protein
MLESSRPAIFVAYVAESKALVASVSIGMYGIIIEVTHPENLPLAFAAVYKFWEELEREVNAMTEKKENRELGFAGCMEKVIEIYSNGRFPRLVDQAMLACGERLVDVNA